MPNPPPYIPNVPSWHPPTPEPTICFSVWPPPPVALPQNAASTLPKSEKDRIYDWFIRPLSAFQGEDSIICLMTCCALLETIIRFELVQKGLNPDTDFSDGSQAMIELKAFLNVPDDYTTEAFWRTARNGLLHRGMPNNPAVTDKQRRYLNTIHRLSPEMPGYVTKLEVHQNQTQTLTIYIWELRDKIVQYLESNGEKLWNNQRNPLIEIVTS